MNAPDTPAKIGRFTVIKLLGPGAYGLTYLVHDAASDPFALKQLRKDAPKDGRFRFKNERWALENLRHPAIPRFIEEGEDACGPYIVMSYAEGKTLRRLVEQNQHEGGFVPVSRVLLVAERVLDCLVYLEKEHITHRDIKDDNVIVSASGEEVTLIDFGLCKGPAVPEIGQTFVQAGACKFSPPSKLANPSVTQFTHDTFAVGVLGYYLLTNTFPWEVPGSEDAGHLADQMRHQRPRSIRETNTLVSDSVARFFMSLLEIEDFKRPRAEAALKEARSLRASMEASAPRTKGARELIQFPRVFRDPLHGDILATDFEREIVNTREFQRLRRVRQLGTSHLVYHGADHTRFSHAVGTMHVAEKILGRIEVRQGEKFSAEERLTARAFALLHDVGHAPFGHTLEDELGLFRSHDQNSDRLYRILEGTGSEAGNLLQTTSYGRQVLEMLLRTERVSSNVWLEELTTSASGADVIDYIDRDSLYCGLDHRVDSAIYRRYSIEKTQQSPGGERHVVSKLYGRHGFRLDADYAALSVLRERHALFLKVYNHPVKLCAGAMIGKAVWCAMKENPTAFSEYAIERMGDEELLFTMQSYGPQSSQQLVERYWSRRLFAPVFSAQVLSSNELSASDYDTKRKHFEELGLFAPDVRDELERKIAKSAGVSPEQVILYLNRRAPGAQKVRRTVETGENSYLTHTETDPRHRSVFTQHLGLWTAYLFVAPEVDSDAKRLLGARAEDLFELKNQVDLNRRQLALGLR